MWRFMGGRFSRSTRCMSSSSRAFGWWEHVSPAPKDPITGVTEAFLADTNPNKINLGVGAYRDDQGKPVVLQCVRNAEAKIAACEFQESNATAVGSKLVEESVKLAYGTHAHVVKEGRVAGLQALSGTGACRLFAELQRRFYPRSPIYLPYPTWSNHHNIWRDAQVPERGFRYYNPITKGLDFAALMDDVKGCDGSVLLDPTPTIDSEKTAIPNNNSIRGFEVVDNIKSEVDKACGGPVVSCADILAVAARDSVVALGGPAWEVQLGRRDSTTASRTTADADLPLSNMTLTELIDNFKKQGLDETDLVVLSGGHTLGFARCLTFRDRIYNETNIDGAFAEKLKSTCPKNPNDGDSNLASLDPTPAYFDTAYFNNLVQQKGLLHSDQALFSGGCTDPLVNKYSSYPIAFWQDFAKSMVKMGNIKPLTGYQGEIRLSCRKVNQ